MKTLFAKIKALLTSIGHEINNVGTIFKKEFSRVMKDRRLVLMVIVLPGLMIYVMYSFMGNITANLQTEEQEHQAIILAVNLPESIRTIAGQGDHKVTFTAITAVDDAVKNKLLTKEADLIVSFSSDFENLAETNSKPTYEIYFNSGEANSTNAFQVFTGFVGAYEKTILIQENVDTSRITYPTPTEVKDEVKETGKAYGSLLPFLIIIFLFAGAMSIGPESISGEKERGTIATLLITPVRRGEIALGKVLSISALSAISAVSSFVGIIASIPNLVKGTGANVVENIYGPKEYLLILLVLVATVVFIVGLVSIASAFAKSVKEANMYILPLYFACMVIGISTMFKESSTVQMVPYLIPMYNTVISLSSIFLFEVNPLNITICIISNLVYTGLLIYILTRMFNNEHIMYSKS